LFFFFFLFFFLSQDKYMNKYCDVGDSDLSARASGAGHRGKRGRGARTSMLWHDADEGIGRDKGSNESVYEVTNLDLLVSEVDEFVHFGELFFYFYYL
jgi:hypothetical protein